MDYKLLIFGEKIELIKKDVEKSNSNANRRLNNSILD